MVTIKLRRDTAANWTTNNPVLALGEPGLETDTRKVKYGDGVTAWTSLAYAAGGAGATELDALTDVDATAATNAGYALVSDGDGTYSFAAVSATGDLVNVTSVAAPGAGTLALKGGDGNVSISLDAVGNVTVSGPNPVFNNQTVFVNGLIADQACTINADLFLNNSTIHATSVIAAPTASTLTLKGGNGGVNSILLEDNGNIVFNGSVSNKTTFSTGVVSKSLQYSVLNAGSTSAWVFGSADSMAVVPAADAAFTISTYNADFAHGQQGKFYILVASGQASTSWGGVTAGPVTWRGGVEPVLTAPVSGTDWHEVTWTCVDLGGSTFRLLFDYTGVYNV